MASLNKTVRQTLMFVGISCKSFSFLLGIITLLIPALCAANTFSLIPPTLENKDFRELSSKDDYSDIWAMSQENMSSGFVTR